MTQEIFARMESKIDKLTEAVTRLVLIEERQTRQGERIGALEQRAAVIEDKALVTKEKLDKWINRGVGVWGVVLALFAIYKLLNP